MLNINSSYRNFQTQPSIGFKGLSDENKSQVTTGADEKSQTKLSTKGKVILGTTLTGLAALGIYLATRGKAKPSTIHTPSEPISEYTIDAFKKAGGKFEKGESEIYEGNVFKGILAKYKDGTNYTGTLTQTTKDGKNLVIKYIDGRLVKSTKYEGDNILWSKEYVWRNSGSKLNIYNANKEEILSVRGRGSNSPAITNYKRNSEVIFENNKIRYRNKEGHLDIFDTDGKAIKYTVAEKDNKIIINENGVNKVYPLDTMEGLSLLQKNEIADSMLSYTVKSRLL